MMTRSRRASGFLAQSIAFLAVFLGACAALELGSGAAFAQGGSCLYSCQGSLCSDFGNKSDLCMELRAKCQAYCSGRRYFGAIAYSKKDGSFGWSVDRDDQDRAERDAVRYCAERGSACKSVVWYYNSCGAIAADGATVGWGRASAIRQAQQIALSECAKAGGRQCVLKVSKCSPTFPMGW